MGRLAALYDRLLAYPGRVVLLALLSAMPMLYWSTLLFGDLRADLKELLPENARSVRTLRELERRFGGFSQLSILVESPDRAANRRFSDALVEALKRDPRVRSVRNKLGEEREFFEARRFLYVDKEDLDTILERIEDAANDARARANPLLVDLENKGPVSLDLSDIEKKYASKLALADRFPEGYFERPDGHQLAVLVRKKGLAFGIAENAQLVHDVEALIAGLRPTSFHPEMQVRLGGDVRNVVQEHESLIEDLALASGIVALLLALVVVAYYRRLRALYLIAVPVLVGCAWTFGISHFWIGYLNASTAFLGPIIPGNGMNFGLILLARYIEERRRGLEVERAVRVAVSYTARATSMVALAAAVAYGSLVATDFLGFKHFGLIGGLGMLLCWVATFVVMPPLVVLIERRFPPQRSAELKVVRPGALAALPAGLVAHFAPSISWIGVSTGVVALALGAVYLRDPFEKDFNKLRSRVALSTGSAYVAKAVDDIFGMGQEPQVIIAERDEDVPEIVEHLQKIVDQGERAPLSDVTALATLVPKDQEQKLKVLAEIRRVLSDDLLSNLEEADRKKALAHRPPAELAAFGPKDLPESVRADFRELDGREGRVVLALPNIKLNLYHADDIQKVADAVRTVRLKDGREVESSGNFVIYSDMVRAVSGDGPKATVLSLLGVLVLCAIAYRHLRRVALVSASLLLGVGWLGAVLELFAVRINFLNFIALPITFGIGVDYAINVYSRYLIERQHKSAAGAVHDTIISTGGAVALCSLTTMIGYASLLVARNGALVSFGKIAILGEVTCLAAALLVLPAWLRHWSDEG